MPKFDEPPSQNTAQHHRHRSSLSGERQARHGRTHGSVSSATIATKYTRFILKAGASQSKYTCIVCCQVTIKSMIHLKVKIMEFSFENYPKENFTFRCGIHTCVSFYFPKSTFTNRTNSIPESLFCI